MTHPPEIPNRPNSPDSNPDGDTINPGRTPDEVVPDDGDIINPQQPDEIAVERGDVIQPANSPHEVPPETITPPD